jgi:hypothetical protein
MKIVSVEYYTLNLTVLPPANNTTEYYSELIDRVFNSDITFEHGAYKYRITKLDNIENGEIFYGIISKYARLDGLEWVENASDSPVDYSVPDNIQGRRATYEFLFFPTGHKFAFVKKGKIDQSEKRGRAPLKTIAIVLKNTIDIVLTSEQKTCELNIVQSNQIFDEIYSSTVKSLDLTVSYSNPGLGDDHEQLMDEYLRNANIGKARVVMQPDSTGSINTDEVFARGLLDLAKENGKVVARIENEEGQKTINTEDHPKVSEVFVEKTQSTEINLIRKILQKFKQNHNN